jgi:hypothetical protein
MRSRSQSRDARPLGEAGQAGEGYQNSCAKIALANSGHSYQTPAHRSKEWMWVRSHTKARDQFGAHQVQERGPKGSSICLKLLMAEAGIDVRAFTSVGLIVLFPPDIGVTTGPPWAKPRAAQPKSNIRKSLDIVFGVGVPRARQQNSKRHHGRHPCRHHPQQKPLIRLHSLLPPAIV